MKITIDINEFKTTYSHPAEARALLDALTTAAATTPSPVRATKGFDPDALLKRSERTKARHAQGKLKRKPKAETTGKRGKPARDLTPLLDKLRGEDSVSVSTLHAHAMTVGLVKGSDVAKTRAIITSACKRGLLAPVSRGQYRVVESNGASA